MSDLEIKQYERAVLREKFLNIIEWMESKQIVIETYQGALVTGTFRAVDYDFTNIHVSSLATPIGSVPEALVRTSDIISIKCLINK